MIRVVHPGSGSILFTHPGSRIQGSKRHRIPDPDPQHRFHVGSWLFWLVVGCLQGWYIVTYALAIYHLNLFLAFLTPKIDPAMSELDGDEGMPNSLYSLSFRHFHRLFKIKFFERVVSATIFTNSQSKYCLILRCTVTPVEYGNWIEIRLLKTHPRYLIFSETWSCVSVII